MSISNITPIAIALALLTVAKTGSLVAATNFIRHAQIQLIEDSKANKWPKAMTLPSRNSSNHRTFK